MTVRSAAAFAAAAALAAVACSGGGSSATTAPSNGGSGSPGASGATITITSAGVSPKSVTVAAGSQVTFVNNDNVTHNMQSDPHPEHTDCPELGSVGFLTPGQSHNTGNLNIKRTCGYHDHDNAGATKLLGSIVIQ